SAATLAGAGLTLTSIDPIAMLFWTAVINGIVAVPIMVVMMIVIAPRGGQHVLALPAWLKVLGWLATALMALAVALMVWSTL
ncbi:MAG: divalent metal cation transporter, partial [Rhizomicrobium sp.]